jgi:hypothetical protein
MTLEGREHGVEAGIGERQRFGVGFLELDQQAIRLGAQAAALQEARHIVGGDHLAPATCRGEGGIAVAGGDIEDFLPRANVEGFAKLLADDLQGGADHGIIAGGPGAVLTGLQRLEVDMVDLGVLGCGRCGHDYSYFL